MIRNLPVIHQLGPNRWQITWPGKSPHECNTAALQAVLDDLTVQQRHIVFKRALAAVRKRRATA